MRSLFLILIIQLIHLAMYSQDILPENPQTTTRILFVFDASQSMAGTWESDQKINIARNILIDLTDSLQRIENIQLALRIYGHQSPVPPQDCNDTRLEVPFGPNSAARIKQKLQYITPKGTTPIAHSLALSVNDFPECDNCRNIVILITDGIEACDGDPCAVSQELQRNGIVLKPFVIGIGIDPGFRKTFDCVGYYYNSFEEIEFKEALGFVVNQILNSTTAQVNLLDEKGMPTETDVSMTFYDRYSGKIIYNFIHTLNQKGNPDTLELDHLITYKLKVHTLPPIEIDSISITPDIHTIIPVSTPQGYLLVKTSKGKVYDGLPFIVRKKGKMKTLNHQRIGQTEKYITGEYDIEIPTIPPILTSSKILQSYTTIIQIDQPGTITISSKSQGFGSIYHLSVNEQTKIYNLNPSLRQQTINIQPGVYRIIYRAAGSKNSLSTKTRDILVKPGANINIDFF